MNGDAKNSSLLRSREESLQLNIFVFSPVYLTGGISMLSKELGAEGLLPGVCRGDYLSAHLMGNGFERTKTLGDGDDCCNCRYYVKGDCDWSPDKGFENRK